MKTNYIYNESCEQTIEKMLNSNTKVNLVVTSPPYNMNLRIRYGKYVSRSLNEKGISNKYDGFNDNLPLEDYFDFHLRVIKNLLKFSNILFYNISIVTGSKRAWFRIIGELNEYLKDIIIWDKVNGEPARLNGIINRASELLLIFDKDNAISRQFSNVNFDRGCMNDVWKIKRKRTTCSLNRAVFPVELVDKIITNFSNVNDVIYDPFSGTGTTCMVAKQLNRKYIGSEINEGLFNFSLNRIQEGLI